MLSSFNASRIFSMLVLLDGGTELPGFSVTPDPHESDKEYNQEKGRNWFPDDAEIAGCLHEEWCNIKNTPPDLHTP